MRLRLVETPRFIIFSDADAAMTDLLVKGCDALYANLCKQFDFGARDRVWDGKCCVLVFGSSVSYETRAKKFDNMAADFSAEATPAYASVIGGPPGVPRLAYMCFSSGRRDPDAVVHEVTHIFFKAYASPGKLPLWLQEGVAVFMEVVNDPKTRGTYLGPAVRFARSGSAMSYFYGIAAPRDFKLDHYCVAYSLVEYLVARDRTKFKAFVQGIRDGKSAEDAMKASYAFGLSDLERQWRVWIMSPGIAKFDTGGPSTPGMKFSPANTTDK